MREPNELRWACTSGGYCTDSRVNGGVCTKCACGEYLDIVTPVYPALDGCCIPDIFADGHALDCAKAPWTYATTEAAKEATDAAYAQGVENTEARAIKRIALLEADLADALSLVKRTQDRYASRDAVHAEEYTKARERIDQLASTVREQKGENEKLREEVAATIYWKAACEKAEASLEKSFEVGQRVIVETGNGKVEGQIVEELPCGWCARVKAHGGRICTACQRDNMSALKEALKDPAYAKIEPFVGVEKCAVKDCTNKRHQGTFVGPVCMPCYENHYQGWKQKHDDLLAENTNMVVLLDQHNRHWQAVANEIGGCYGGFYDDMTETPMSTGAVVIKRIKALKAERDAFRDQFDAELSGNATLRKKYGAKDSETMWDFLERLSNGRHLAEKDWEASAKAIADLENELQLVRDSSMPAKSKEEWDELQAERDSLKGHLSLAEDALDSWARTAREPGCDHCMTTHSLTVPSCCDQAEEEISKMRAKAAGPLPVANTHDGVNLYILGELTKAQRELTRVEQEAWRQKGRADNLEAEHARCLQRHKDSQTEWGRLNAELHAELQDYKNDYRATMAEGCDLDARHCTCVPGLKKRVKDLELCFTGCNCAFCMPTKHTTLLERAKAFWFGPLTN